MKDTSVKSNEPPVYKHSFEHARNNDEVKLYHQSSEYDRKCCVFIDECIGKSYYGENQWDVNDAVVAVRKQFSDERISWVLAFNINFTPEYDVRLKRPNREWAKQFHTPLTSDCHLNSHKVILDMFAELYRRAIAEQVKDTPKKTQRDNRS